MSGELSAHARADLEDLRSRFREAAVRHPGLRHVLITASDPDVIREISLAAVDAAFPGKVPFPIPYTECGELHVYLGTRQGKVLKGIAALEPLAADAVAALVAHRILAPAAPPPSDPAPIPWPAWKGADHLWRWTRFVHECAEESPRELPWAAWRLYPAAAELARLAAWPEMLREARRRLEREREKVPMGDPTHSRLFDGRIAAVSPQPAEWTSAAVRTLGYGVFASSAMILSRLIDGGIAAAPAADAPAEDDGAYTRFARVVEITGLPSWALTRATSGPNPKVRSRGRGRGKLVHVLDAFQYAEEWRRRRQERDD